MSDMESEWDINANYATTEQFEHLLLDDNMFPERKRKRSVMSLDSEDTPKKSDLDLTSFDSIISGTYIFWEFVRPVDFGENSN